MPVVNTPLPYGQDNHLSGSPDRISSWITGTSSSAMSELLGRIKARTSNGLELRRPDVDAWVRDCTRYDPPSGGTTTPGGGSGGGTTTPPRGDVRKPPQVGAKDHQTVAARLQYQARGLHLPYVRSASYDQQVPANTWTRAALRAHDDPYQITSGNGMIINQDGLWTITVKTDWSIGHAEVVVGAAQATRLMVNGHDVGLRDYLDDDAYSSKIPINTLTWSDTFRAGTTLNIDVRTEGLGANYTAVCNVYLRAHLVRCFDGGMDMETFPAPPSPTPGLPLPELPMGGYCGPNDHAPAIPHRPGTCNETSFAQRFLTNDAGQVGYLRCVNGELIDVWSSTGWGSGGSYGGGSTGSNIINSRDIYRITGW
ncbi:MULTISPECIES: hypothetical protein [Streptosporangium]|uniref:Uncharacterized protein n=1 Tax=Streptosporangium brasiliense TaxID=47480 RepID=A0ABT9RMD1_9ACTN|nr:hypothetical protein [Streptosporangium brasiliense]MDP9870459.1 hypothetical protein [Streptosporangium brasiliense]